MGGACQAWHVARVNWATATDLRSCGDAWYRHERHQVAATYGCEPEYASQGASFFVLFILGSASTFPLPSHGTLFMLIMAQCLGQGVAPPRLPRYHVGVESPRRVVGDAKSARRLAGSARRAVLSSVRGFPVGLRALAERTPGNDSMGATGSGHTS